MFLTNPDANAYVGWGGKNYNLKLFREINYH